MTTKNEASNWTEYDNSFIVTNTMLLITKQY